MVLGTASTLVWLWVRALAWRTLLLDKPSMRDTFLTINEGYLLNNLLPLRLGELGRAYLISRKAGLDFWQVMPAVVIERVLDLAVGVGLLLVSLPLVIGADWARPVAFVAAGLVLAGLATLYILARRRQWALSQIDRWGRRWPSLLRLGGGILPALFNGLEVLTDTGRFLRAVGLILLNWGMGIFQFFVFIRAFFPQSTWLWAVFTLGVVTLGVAAPSSPGNIGPLEWALIGGVSAFGADLDTAAVFAFVLHLLQYLITCSIGAYALTRDGESLLGLYGRVRGLKKNAADG